MSLGVKPDDQPPGWLPSPSPSLVQTSPGLPVPTTKVRGVYTACLITHSYPSLQVPFPLALASEGVGLPLHTQKGPDLQSLWPFLISSLFLLDLQVTFTTTAPPSWITRFS